MGIKKSREKEEWQWEKREKICCLCHAPWYGIRNQYVKLVPDVKKTTRTANDVMLHLYRVHVYSLHVDWMESAEKQTNERVQIFNTTTLGLLHKLDGVSLSTHAGRMPRPISQTPALANPLRIASPAQNNKSIDDSGNSKQLSTNL